MPDKHLPTYFVRHTAKLEVHDAAIDRLVSEERIGVHFPGDGPEDSRSLDPADYTSLADQRGIRAIAALAAGGGYVWSEYRTSSEALIGLVSPDTRVEYHSAIWRRRSGRPAVLTTLKMQKVRRVRRGQLLPLRATRPRQGTISRWHKAGEIVRRLVEGEELTFGLGVLSPGQLETLCAEFLRSVGAPLPTLSALLMPVGRTMKDVDFVALAEDGHRIFAQVTMGDESTARNKARRLSSYGGDGAYRLMFCHCERLQSDGEVLWIPLSMVHDWSAKHPGLRRALVPTLRSD